MSAVFFVGVDMSNTAKRFFQLERAVTLLMEASVSQKIWFLVQLRRAGIVIEPMSLRDPRVGVVVRRHDQGRLLCKQEK